MTRNKGPEPTTQNVVAQVCISGTRFMSVGQNRYFSKGSAVLAGLQKNMGLSRKNSVAGMDRAIMNGVLEVSEDGKYLIVKI